MPVNELEILVSSNVNDAVKGTERLGKAFNNVDKQASGSLSKSLQNIEKLLEQISKTSYTSSLALTSNFQKIPKEVNNANRALGTTTQSLSKFSKSGVNTQQVFNGLNNTVRDLPFGFIAIQNNLTQVADALLGAGKAALFIGFGFSVAVTAITQLVQKYGSLGNAINQIFNLENDLEKQTRRLNSIYDEAAKSVGSEISQLEILRTKLLDVNAPQEERRKALEAFNKVADENNKLSVTDINNLSKINALISSQITLLGQRAIAAAAQKELSAEAEKLFSVQKRTAPVLNRVSNLFIQQAKDAADATKGIKNLRLATQDEVESDSLFSGSINKQLKDVAQIRFSKEYKDAERELNAAQTAFNKALGEIAPFIDFDGITTKNTAKTTKDVKTISSVLTELQKDITGLNVAFAAMGGSITDLAGDKLQKFKKALQDLSDLGVRPGDAVFNQLQGQIDLLQNSLSKTPVTLTIPKLKIVIPKATSNTAEIFKSLVDSFDFDALRLNLERGINDALQNLSLSGIQSIGDAIGGAITGSSGGIQDAIKGFLTLLGGFFQQVGIQLLTYSKVLTGLQIAIKSLNPYVAAIAGGLAIIAGGALKAYASNLPSFATGGGVVGGPTLAMIGDNPGREEYVIPSEVLDKIGGGGSGFIAETRLSGTDILIAVRRAMGNSNRVNG